MKLAIRLCLLASIIFLSGCVSTLFNLKTNTSESTYAHLPSFEYAGTSIYYRDLSNPCDPTTVSWKPINEDGSATELIGTENASCPVATLEETQTQRSHKLVVQRQFSLPFSARQSEPPEKEGQVIFQEIKTYALGSAQFQIHGAAGTVGDRSEELGLARAEYVKERLLEMGVQSERVTVMPYDPEIPGLQAIVKVMGNVL